MSKRDKTEKAEENREIARIYAKRFSSEIKVTVHCDEFEESSVHIFFGLNSPKSSVSSFGTIGVSDAPLFSADDAEQDFRLELVGASPAEFVEFGSALATAAFCIMKDEWPCYPGAHFPDIMKMYRLSKTMSDICFVDPFLWPSSFERVKLTGKQVAYWQAIPISRQMVLKYSAQDLRKKWQTSWILIEQVSSSSSVA